LIIFIDQMTNNEEKFKKFLNILADQKEVGLVIAKNEKELGTFVKILNEAGLKQSEGVADLLKSPKTYFVVSENFNKDIYDFVVQYPTGQLEVFNKQLMQSQTFYPDYKNSVVILLVDKDNLNKIQEKGFDILSATGPAFQA